MSRGVSSSSASSPVQIVGTPPARVGRAVSIRSASGSGVRNRSGMTSEAPVISAAYGMPQAFTWNIGTIRSTRSACRIPNPSGMQTCIECR